MRPKSPSSLRSNRDLTDVLGSASNRSASLLKLQKVNKALEDAEACIAIKPDWEKGVKPEQLAQEPPALARLHHRG